jgi:hypothetical protein
MERKKIFTLLLLAFTFSNSKWVRADAWDALNNPAQLDVQKNYEYNFKKLPLAATLKVIPWSETYWPTRKGSINVRWNTPTQDGFKYVPNTLEQLKKLSAAELEALSPSEKYDIDQGHYDYPLWTEAKQYGNPLAGEYSGMCDGWSVAAIQYAEPARVTLMNPDGIAVPFGSSDVKGLMTYAAEIHADREIVQVGAQCTTSSPTTPEEVKICAGINAGSVHVILANQIGLKQQGFVTQRQPNIEDWNQPTYAYQFQALGSALSSVPGAHGLLIHGILYYSEDIDVSHLDPVTGTSQFKFSKVVMDYTLDLDANENIVGGTWSKGSDHLGFMWLPTNRLQFQGIMSGLNAIYKAVGTAQN